MITWIALPISRLNIYPSVSFKLDMYEVSVIVYQWSPQ